MSAVPASEPITPAAVHVGPSAIHGTGVFAARRFEVGEVIERSPVFIFPADQLAYVDETVLSGYYFDWHDGAGALALGFGSLYNHSYAPNASYHHDHDEELVVYEALVVIEPGDEITINYNGDPACQDALWFDAE
jgi:SET domain-containing protein